MCKNVINLNLFPYMYSYCKIFKKYLTCTNWIKVKSSLGPIYTERRIGKKSTKNLNKIYYTE